MYIFSDDKEIYKPKSNKAPKKREKIVFINKDIRGHLFMTDNGRPKSLVVTYYLKDDNSVNASDVIELSIKLVNDSFIQFSCDNKKSGICYPNFHLQCSTEFEILSTRSTGFLLEVYNSFPLWINIEYSIFSTFIETFIKLLDMDNVDLLQDSIIIYS